MPASTYVPGPGRWWGVVLASGGLHALFFLLVVADLRQPSPAPSSPLVEVWLGPPVAVAEPATRTSPKAQRRARGQLARARALTGDQSSGLVDAASAVAAPPAISAPLLGLLRCRQATLDRLAPEAREQCLERLAVIDSPPPRVDLDLTGRYARDRTPYLARPPKNGCKLVSGVADGVNGTVDGKMGVGCAFSF